MSPLCENQFIRGTRQWMRTLGMAPTDATQVHSKTRRQTTLCFVGTGERCLQAYMLCMSLNKRPYIVIIWQSNTEYAGSLFTT